YLVCYVQEKDGTEWQRLYSRSISAYDNPAHEVLLTGLTSSTDYSYKIGFANRYSTTLEDLANVTEGTFTTYADTRKVEITGTTPRSISANIAYTLSGMEYAGDGYLIGYVKKKADADAAWNLGFSVAISDQDTTGTVLIERLEEQTEYELTVGFGDRSGDSKENLKHIQTVTFTTLEDQRKLSDPKASVNGTNATLSVYSEGNIEYTNTYVHFFYRVKGNADYNKAERVINASRVKEKECSVTLTGLNKGVTYEFAAVLSEGRYSCDEPDDVTKAEYKTEATEFTIAAGTGTQVKQPTSMKLSQTELSLNANAAYRNDRGFGYEILNVTVNPANATKGFDWESSDDTIVTVSGGRVTAVAPGTAVVTAKSIHNPDATAVCEITVENYQFAKKSESGTELLDSSSLNTAKGSSITGYTVCKVKDDGSIVELEFSVTSNNDAVVSWNESEGAIESNNTGTTRLVFETKEDHVKLYLTVTVSSAPGKGFTVTGFKASAGYNAYAAVQNAENEYTLAYTPGISYSAEGEIVPKNPLFNKSDFNWSIDKADVATVDEWGNVTPLKAGVAVLTVTPKEEGEALYTKETCTVTLHVQSLASDALANENVTPVYALADICSTIGDVKFPDDEAWKGWEWKEPATPLVINGVNKEYYPFEAVYKGEDHYPEEMTVDVYIAKITGISAYEDTEPGHNQVVEVGSVDGENSPAEDSDSITLTVEPLYYGSLNDQEATNYFFDVTVDAPAGVIVKKNADGTFTVTATKKGNYTLTPAIRVKDKNNSNEKILAKTSYKIKAVEEEQAYIRLALEEPVPDGVKLEDGRLLVDYDKKDEVSSFKVIAELTDRNQMNAENFSTTKLTWSVTDKKVATVNASADTKSAEVKLVGEGHTILTAKVKDAAGHKAELKVEIQNHKPRVNTSNVQVNLAFDYDTEEGRLLAAWSSGAVEIISVYGEAIQSVNLYEDEKAETLCSELRTAKGNGYNWVIRPNAGTRTGEGSYYLGVKTTFRDELYVYPLKVKVVEQQATVTAKSARSANLFYRSDPGSLDIGIKGVYYGISNVKWTDNSASEDNGFASEGTTNYFYDYTKRTKNTRRYYFVQQDIQLTANKKLADSGIVSGTVEIQLSGYKKPNVVNASLKWNYKKPVINTISASVTLIPEVPGKKNGSFRLYNKTEAQYLYYTDDSYSSSNPKYYYNELISNSEDVKFGSAGSTNYSYAGSKTSGSEKFTVTLNGDDWREPLTAAHTIKLAAPNPYLSSTKLIMNTNRVGSMYTYV
ncbi:MAG: Ig-like domain-containing protein, partial [Lachnospiraceae bacterium]|nr:Ig-like domain-containing protein [Lachnospiraceae bacterium]